MYRYVFFILMMFFLLSCSTERDSHIVKYIITDATTDVQIEYKNDAEEMIQLTKHFASEEDSWEYSMLLDEGDLFFLSARYLESNASVKVLILIDEKVVKEKSSENEPEKYVIVSGAVPY